MFLVWACVVKDGFVSMVFSLVFWVSAGAMGEVVVAMVCVRVGVTIRSVDAVGVCVLINGVDVPYDTVWDTGKIVSGLGSNWNSWFGAPVGLCNVCLTTLQVRDEQGKVLRVRIAQVPS